VTWEHRHRWATADVIAPPHASVARERKATADKIVGASIAIVMPETLPTVQKAWVLRRPGKPRNVLKLEETYPVPIPKDRQLLIRVHAVALNRKSCQFFYYDIKILDLSPTTTQPGDGIAFLYDLYLFSKKHQQSPSSTFRVSLWGGEWTEAGSSSVRRCSEFRLLKDQMECTLSAYT
jgi:hypothetical protein